MFAGKLQIKRQRQRIVWIVRFRMSWERFVDEEGIGCILEVDLEYPVELHDFHNDFPLAPERLTLGKVEKLTQNLRDKEKMVLHGKNLALFLSLGMKLASFLFLCL